MIMKDIANLLELRVRPKGRTHADEYVHRGEVYIEGRSNSWYSLELVNHSHGRILAVVSVDGLSVNDGEPASYESKGFVVNPSQTVVIPGWQQSSQEAARFVFGNKAESYSESMGHGTQNAGVIGVAFYQEVISATSAVVPCPIYAPVDRSLYMKSALIGSAVSNVTQSQPGSLGTGWGEQVAFNTVATTFNKATLTPAGVMVLKYDSAQALQRMGIKLMPRYTTATNQAFPGNNTGYCKPPPVWTQKTTRS